METNSKTKLIMGMPITLQIAGSNIDGKIFDLVFNYFKYVDEKFSTYKETSEISKINRGVLSKENYSADMQEVLALSQKTKKDTANYFDIKNPVGKLDPSGLVKGWAIHKAANLLKENGVKNFCIEGGGDIETSGVNSKGRPWTVGIRNPFNHEEVVKVLESRDRGIATSGNYIRGNHIYNPQGAITEEIVSMTVVGPNIYEADRFATAAFAMGVNGIMFIENLPGFEGYVINNKGIATMTRGFEKYTK